MNLNKVSQLDKRSKTFAVTVKSRSVQNYVNSNQRLSYAFKACSNKFKRPKNAV